MARAVFCTSSPFNSPVIWVSPTAIAPRIRARWDMDLSPGILAVPFKGLPLLAFIGIEGWVIVRIPFGLVWGSFIGFLGVLQFLVWKL